MDEWMSQSVSQLKRLVKSRAGRIAELQMEIKILEGIIDRKVQQGELGGSPGSAPEKKEQPKPAPEEKPSPAPKEEAAAEEPKQELSKISAKSSDHAFEELD